MRVLNRICVGVAAGAVLAAPSYAQNLVVNGGFEIIAPPVGNYRALAAGNTTLTGWTIGGGGIDIIGTRWQASPNGGNNIDLNNLAPGSITQTITTPLTAGTIYALDYYIAGNPEGNQLPANKTLDLFFNLGATTEFTTSDSFNVTGKTVANMGWQFRHVRFTPTTTGIYNLVFLSTTTGSRGPAIDGLDLHILLPEPGSFAIAAMGLLPLAFVLRRRRK